VYYLGTRYNIQAIVLSKLIANKEFYEIYYVNLLNS